MRPFPGEGRGEGVARMPNRTCTRLAPAAAILLMTYLASPWAGASAAEPAGPWASASAPDQSRDLPPAAPGAALVERSSPNQSASPTKAEAWTPALPTGFELEAEELLRKGNVVYRRLRRSQTSPSQAPALIHVAYVNLEAPGLVVQLSPEKHKGTTPSTLARQAGSLLSLNASFFDEQGRALGLTISDGKPWAGTRDTKKYWVFGCKSPLECQLESPSVSGKSFRTFPFAVSGRPVLVRGGKPRTEQDDRLCLDFCASAHPRSAVGLDRQRNVLFLAAAEGRRYPIQGLGLAEWAGILFALGAHEALNLDGGGSTALVVKGRLMTARPANEFAERPVANVIHVK